MNKYWKAIGIAAVAAGVLYYPVVRLYKYLQDRKDNNNEEDTDHHVIKHYAPAYRGGKHKHNHHKPTPGHMDAGTGLA